MSNFLLGLVGAAVGSAFGMPALGFTVGSGLGSVFSHHHGSAPSQERSRLNDLKVQTSTYGVAIPRVYGTYRLAGNILWAKDILEVKGPKDQYAYYGNFALGLCAGPLAGIRRVWADGKLLLQPAADDPPGALLSTYPTWCRFYPGDESQLPDPLIAKDHAQAPAFRGLAYLVFENFPLANVNNRLPILTVEVVQVAREEVLPPPPVAPQETERLRGRYDHRTRDGWRTPLQATKPVIKKNPWVVKPVPLAHVVSDLCAQVGVANVEASTLRTEVRGFVVAQGGSAREALHFLQQAYCFDMTESSGQITCYPRGLQIPTRLAEEAIGATEEGEAAVGLVISRAQTFDMPQSVTVLFSDATQDYAMGTTTAQRSQGAGMRAERVEWPLALTPLEAARMADRLLREAWAARTQFAFSLSRQYAFLEHGDVVVIQNQRMRLVAIDYGSPGLLKVKAVADPAFLYEGYSDKNTKDAA